MKFISSKKVILFSAISIFLGLGIFFNFTLAKSQASYADDNTGKLTINGQTEVSYDGFCVFNASINPASAESGYKEDVTNIFWSSDSIKEVTLNFIRNNGYNKESDFAPDVLYFIKTQIESDGISTTSIADYFSYKFAKELVENTKVEVTTTINSGEMASLSQGYWLFVSPNNLDLSKSATCPIWTSVREGEKTVNEKAKNVPGLSKSIKLPDGSKTKVFDGRVGQELEFEICGTLDENFKMYPTYRYMVKDTMDTFLELVLNEEGKIDYSFIDQNGNSYIPDVLTYDSITNVIEFGFYDIKKISGLTEDTVLYFTYKAKVKNRDSASSAIFNNAVLTYSNNPATYTTATSTATENSTSKIYNFILNINVVDANSDKGTEPGLAILGAKFCVKTEDGQYVQSDGSIASQEYIFITDASGLFKIPGLSHGKYTFTEIEAPEGYNLQENDVEITIGTSYDEYNLVELSGDIKGGYTKPIGSKWQDNQIMSIDKDTCTITAKICNLHVSNVLPITGLAGYALIATFALIVLIICGVGIYKVRIKSKNANK